MKYLIIGPNRNIIQRRAFVQNPETNDAVRVPPKATVLEISNSKADEILSVIESLEQGETVILDEESNAVVRRAVDNAAGKPFRRQLSMVTQGVSPQLRSKLIEAIGPGLALDDIPAMIASLDAVDVSGADARVGQLKEDLTTVLGREAAKRSNL